MFHPRRLLPALRAFGAAGALSLGLAAPAAALSPDELWQAWQDQLEEAGFTITARVLHEDDLLILDRLALTLPRGPEPDAPRGFALELRGLQLRQLAAGLVQVELPAALPFSVDTARGTDVWRGQGRLLQDKFVMRVHEAEDGLVHDFTAGALNLSLDELVTQGVAHEDAVRVIAEDLSGSIRIGDGLERRTEMRSVLYDIDLPAADQRDRVRISGRMEGLEATGRTDPPAIAAAGPGVSRESHLTYESGQMQAELLDEETTFALSTASGGGTLTAMSDGSRMEVSAHNRNMAFALEGNALSLPLSGKIGDLGLKTAGPVTSDIAPSPFSLDLRLTDVTPPDMFWPFIDPKGVIPRAPLSFSASVSGMKQAAEVGEGVALADLPMTGAGRVVRLDVDDLSLTGAGARIGGKGSFTLDPSQPSRFGPFPKAEGRLDLRGDGLIALLEKLGDSGVIPSALVLAAPLYLSIFAEQEGNADILTTILRLTANESLQVNGRTLIP